MDEHQPQPHDGNDIEALGSPATPEALREIVSRHQRTRTRTLGILLAVALIAGPLTGWAIGHAGGGGTQVSAASRPEGADAAAKGGRTAPVGGMTSAQAFGIGGPGADGPKAQHLFSRTSSDGIAIRAYRMDPPPDPKPAAAAAGTSPTTPSSPKTQEAPCPQPLLKREPGSANASSGTATATATAEADSGSSASSSSESPGSAGVATGGAPPNAGEVPPVPPQPCGPLPPSCKATPSVLAEVSNDAAVGQSFDPIDEKQPTEALSHLSVGMLGVIENAPAMVVTVQTGSGVAKVRLRLPSGATDEMAPVSGVAVLAHGSSAHPPEGTVEALDGSGKVLASMNITQPEKTAVIACAFAGSATIGPATAPGDPAEHPSMPPTTR